MTAVQWPTWVAWLFAIAVLLTLFMVWTLMGQVAALRAALAAAGTGQGQGPRSRKELEEAYAAGSLSRDAYERLKGRYS